MLVFHEWHTLESEKISTIYERTSLGVIVIVILISYCFPKLNEYNHNCDLMYGTVEVLMIPHVWKEYLYSSTEQLRAWFVSFIID